MVLKVDSEMLSSGLREQLTNVDLAGIADLDCERSAAIAESARALLPGARAVVVLAMEIFVEVTDLVVPDKVMGEAAARDLLGPHYDYLSGRLNRGLYDAARLLRRQGYRALPLPSQGTPVDARYQRGLFQFKPAAGAAGLGDKGMNGLLITRQFGPRQRLAALITDAPLRATADQAGEPVCRRCGACVRACPSGALSFGGDGSVVFDRFACVAFRGGAGGCLNCLNACRVGRPSSS